MMIGRDIGAGIHGKEGEGFAAIIFAPDARHAEPAMLLHREEPFIEAFLRLVRRIGEFVESVAEYQAAVRRKVTPFGAEIINGLAGRSGPAPSPVDQFAELRSITAPHDRRH